MSLDVSLHSKCTCGKGRDYFFDANITHNLTKMADAAGIYLHLWRPEELGISKAVDLITPLENALNDMRDKPEHYKQFDAENKWGTYDAFIPWITEYLDACKAHPDSTISVSR